MKFFSGEEKEENLLKTHACKEVLNDLEYYILEILDEVIDDKFEVHISSTSKFYFIFLIILDNHLVIPKFETINMR